MRILFQYFKIKYYEVKIWLNGGPWLGKYTKKCIKKPDKKLPAMSETHPNWSGQIRGKSSLSVPMGTTSNRRNGKEKDNTR